jgi:uncharacterized protein YjiK
MRVLNFKFFFVVLLMAVAFSSCRRKVRLLKSPPNYNFSEVFTDKLALKLKEISGIAWDHKSNFFYAVNDEAGKIFLLDKETKMITSEYVFGDKGDYEDVAMMKGIPYILRSDGMIIKIVSDSAGKMTGKELGKISLTGKNDFESLYYDSGRDALVLICKNCNKDNDNTVSAFAFYPDSIGFDNKPLYILDAAKLKELGKMKASKFQPSAAAISPVAQKLFIISAASKQLAITDLDGKVESVFELSEKLFQQPEGITFKQNGDMYIANEGVNAKANLQKFLYTNPKETSNINNSNYNLTKPDEKMELGRHLHEISGMAYVSDKNLILGQNDEKATIYSIDFNAKNDSVGKIKFGAKGDYEDIIHADTADYVLMSTGGVIQIQMKDSLVSTNTYEMSMKGKKEFEAMYLDAGEHRLVLICKECAHEKDEVRMAFQFDLNTKQFSEYPIYSILLKDIKRILNDNNAEFKPSAAAIHPITGKLFIISSVGKLLVIASKEGRPEQAFRLDPVLFNQPEGMAFDPAGNLYISNEAGEGIASILKFNYIK